MWKEILKKFLTRFIFGAFCFSLFPWIAGIYHREYFEKEPYFAAPIIAKNNTLNLRQDKNGKGFFGAPRDGGRTHQGIDITIAVGRPILAAKSGRVVFSGLGKGYGNYIDILHPDGFLSRYAHLSALNVFEGDWVVQGQTVGLSGKTGNASDPRIIPHLHFEIRCQDQALNPGKKLMNPSLIIQRSGKGAL